MFNNPQNSPFGESQKPFIVRLLVNVSFYISCSSNRLSVCIKGKSGLFLRLLLINSLFIHYDDNGLLVTPKRMPNIWLLFNKRILLFIVPYQCFIRFRHFHWLFIICSLPFDWSKNVRNFLWMFVWMVWEYLRLESSLQCNAITYWGISLHIIAEPLNLLMEKTSIAFTIFKIN